MDGSVLGCGPDLIANVELALGALPRHPEFEQVFMRGTLVAHACIVACATTDFFHDLPSVAASMARVPNASSLTGLTVAGYQGWFATPGDDDNSGWVHWGPLKDGKGIQEDYWPEMAEFTPPERHAAPGYSNSDGSPAELFSSDCLPTVMRHFQWMEAYGIDGVAVQRFGVENSNLRLKRRLNYTVAAAEATGRVLYVEYDMSGMHEADIVPNLSADWAMLNEQGITRSPRYIQEGGRPVVGVFGFYMNRFSSTTANAILDIFQKPGPYQAFVSGSGQWFWRKDNPTAEWAAVFHRMNSWSPWNAGNWNGQEASPQAATGYWADDKADFEQHGTLWQPEIYPGMSTDHRDGKPPGSGRIPRAKGQFLWKQFQAAAQLKVKTAFVGMFDELDEGTQLIKVINDPPKQAVGDIGYEGMPSDVYLCWAGKGSAMLRGEIPPTAPLPACQNLTQPTIASSGSVGRIGGTVVRLTWSPALALYGGGTIHHYEVLIDDSASARRTRGHETELLVDMARLGATSTQAFAAGGQPDGPPFSPGMRPGLVNGNAPHDNDT
eukprot:gene8412-207_t